MDPSAACNPTPAGRVLGRCVSPRGLFGVTSKAHRSYHEYLLQNRVSKLPDWAQSTLSKDLLRDVTAHIYSETISSLPMFKSMPAAARTELALELEHVQVPTGEILYEEGVPGDRMYFLRKGTVQMSILLMTEQQKSAFGPTRIHEAIETQIVNRIHKGKFGFHIDGQRECAYSWNVSQHTCSYFGESVLFSESDLASFLFCCTHAVHIFCAHAVCDGACCGKVSRGLPR